MRIQNRAHAIWVVVLITLAATAASLVLTVISIPVLGLDADWRDWLMSTAFPLILAPFFAVPLVVANLRLVKMHRQIERMALTDSLTGLPNRRAFFRNAMRVFAAADAAGRPVAVMMIDVDHFKTINDAHGHGAGDEVMGRIAGAIRDAVRAFAGRTGVFAARIGGDEFAILIADGNERSVTRLAEKIGEEVRRMSGEADAKRTMTVSIGVALREAGEDVDAVLRAADKAAYRAKHEGRDRLVVAARRAVTETDARPARVRGHPRAA